MYNNKENTVFNTGLNWIVGISVAVAIAVSVLFALFGKAV
jgi:hypothetical protein